jgi:hypothetical protein
MLDADFNHGRRGLANPTAFLAASAFRVLPRRPWFIRVPAKLYSPAIILKF